ncbi:MAG: hypothetical protein RLO08_12650 [Parvibaculaceae bacterium]|nr:hypothetical protein [Kangiella sp.]
MRKIGKAAALVALSVSLTGVSIVPSLAGVTTTGTGTRIENDIVGTTKLWGRSLSVPRSGKIVRVMGGTYGFQILDGNEQIVGDFLFPQEAVGFELPAGEYQVKPSVCRIHRHHHVEVTVEY